jgi:hypothetical protein
LTWRGEKKSLLQENEISFVETRRASFKDKHIPEGDQRNRGVMLPSIVKDEQDELVMPKMKEVTLNLKNQS